MQRQNNRWAKVERSRLDSSCRAFYFGAQDQSSRETVNSCSRPQGGLVHVGALLNEHIGHLHGTRLRSEHQWSETIVSLLVRTGAVHQEHLDHSGKFWSAAYNKGVVPTLALATSTSTPPRPSLPASSRHTVTTCPSPRPTTGASARLHTALPNTRPPPPHLPLPSPPPPTAAARPAGAPPRRTPRQAAYRKRWRTGVVAAPQGGRVLQPARSRPPDSTSQAPANQRAAPQCPPVQRIRTSTVCVVCGGCRAVRDCPGCPLTRKRSSNPGSRAGRRRVAEWRLWSPHSSRGSHARASDTRTKRLRGIGATALASDQERSSAPCSSQGHHHLEGLTELLLQEVNITSVRGVLVHDLAIELVGRHGQLPLGSPDALVEPLSCSTGRQQRDGSTRVPWACRRPCLHPWWTWKRASRSGARPTPCTLCVQQWDSSWCTANSRSPSDREGRWWMRDCARRCRAGGRWLLRSTRRSSGRDTGKSQKRSTSLSPRFNALKVQNGGWNRGKPGTRTHRTEASCAGQPDQAQSSKTKGRRRTPYPLWRLPNRRLLLAVRRAKARWMVFRCAPPRLAAPAAKCSSRDTWLTGLLPTSTTAKIRWKVPCASRQYPGWWHPWCRSPQQRTTPWTCWKRTPQSTTRGCRNPGVHQNSSSTCPPQPRR